MEARAFSGLAVNRDVSSMAFDDSVSNSKPQARARAFIFCGKIGIKDPLGSRTVHAMACIAHSEPHIRSGLQVRILGRSISIKVHIHQADLDHAPVFLHGMGCVRAKIHQYLMHLGRISQHHAGPLFEVLSDFNGRGYRCPEEFEGFLDNGSDMQRPFPHFALTAKR